MSKQHHKGKVMAVIPKKKPEKSPNSRDLLYIRLHFKLKSKQSLEKNISTQLPASWPSHQHPNYPELKEDAVKALKLIT